MLGFSRRTFSFPLLIFANRFAFLFANRALTLNLFLFVCFFSKCFDELFISLSLTLADFVFSIFLSVFPFIYFEDSIFIFIARK